MPRKIKPHSVLKSYPKKITDSVSDIAGQDGKLCKKIIDAAIKSRETTNDISDINSWIENHLAPNTVKITLEDYKKVFADSLKTLVSQNKIGFDGSQRPPPEALNDKVVGYVLEAGIVKLASLHGVNLGVAHEEGNPEDFYATDFPEVIENGISRPARINAGAKASSLGASWCEISHSQFIRSDVHIFGKSLSENNHLWSYMCTQIICLKNLEQEGYLENHHVEGIKNKYKFEPIPVYIVGWVENKDDPRTFKYEGSMGRTIYTINKYEGLLPKNYKKIIREKENLSANTRVEFNVIRNFSKSKKADLQIYNLGSFNKTKKEFVDLFRRF